MSQTHTDLDIFASAQSLCAHHSAQILSDRGYFNTLASGSLSTTGAATMVWSQIVENDHERRRFWESALVDIESALATGSINAAIINAAIGLPLRQTEYENWTTKAADALIAATRAGLLASARAEMDTELKMKAEIEELELAELEACYSPVSPIDPMDLAIMDWDGPEPSIGRPSSEPSFLGEEEEEEEEEAAVAAYLDLDGLEPLAEVASVESLTPVKARIVGR